MKKLEITVPEEFRERVEEILSNYSEDITTSEAEREDEAFVVFSSTVESGKIDPLSEELKEITELDRGDLTIRIIDQSAVIEKGKRAEGGSEILSVQEMYSKALSFASFNKTSWLLIALAAGIASFGIIMENVAVVIGAMVIAPMLSPFISASFGLVIGDNTLIKKSFMYGFLSIVFAISAAFLITLPLPVSVNPLMLLLAQPGVLTVLLSLFVGAAAVLTFTTEAREALAGVAVAIALVPPSAVAGITLRMLNFDLFVNVLTVIFTNVISIILAGSLTLKFMGIKPSTYYRKKVSDTQLRKALMISVTSLIIIGLPIAFISYQDYQAVQVQSAVDERVSAAIGGNVLSKEVVVTRETIEIEVVAVNVDADIEALERELRRDFDRRVVVRVLDLEGVERGTNVPES